MQDEHKYTPSGKLRAAGLGLDFDGHPGKLNSITDVAGVTVGYATIIKGDGHLVVGNGPVRTGVTAILPRPADDIHAPVFAGVFSLNGNGELSGSHYIEEAGSFALPVTITNTHSCGVTRDATIRWIIDRYPGQYKKGFALPVAAETYDGFLNDIYGFHVTDSHVFEAINTAQAGALEEGSVGGGTGMKCFGFKAGSGTASRLVEYGGHEFTVGVFVQANFGSRQDLTIRGHHIGPRLAEPRIVKNTDDPGLSSIIAVIATDAPFLPHQLKRLARRATFGIGRTGGFARHGSGDIFLAFSTVKPEPHADAGIRQTPFIPNESIDDFFEAAVQSTEEAILNSMIANESMTGRDGNFVPALPHDRIREMLGLE